jgi:ankyrin repeat protein
MTTYIRHQNNNNFFQTLSRNLYQTENDFHDIKLEYSSKFGFKVQKERKSNSSTRFSLPRIQKFTQASTQLLKLIDQRRSDRHEDDAQRISRFEHSIKICNAIEKIAANLIKSSKNYVVRKDFEKGILHKLHTLDKQVDTQKAKIARKTLELLETEKVKSSTIAAYKNSNHFFITACQRGALDTAERLLEIGFNVNQADDKGITPLIGACQAGFKNLSLNLFNRGANIHATSNDGKNALLIAAEMNLYDVACPIIASDIDVNIYDNEGTTALIQACGHKDNRIAALLLENGAQVNVRNKKGLTPLLHACKTGHIRTILELIENGADFNQTDADGRSPLMWACIRKMATVAEKLIDLKAEVHASDNNQNNAFLLACEAGLEEIAFLLTSCGADVHHSSKDGNTAFLLTCKSGMKTLAELLLDQNVDVHKKNKKGESALLFACMKPALSKIALQLIEKGVDVNCKNSKGLTPLLLSLQLGNKDVALQLLEKTQDLEARDEHDNTALIWACHNNMRDVANGLLKKGADIHTKNKFGSNALGYACLNKHESFALELLDRGIDYNIKLPIDTPFWLACRSGMAKVINKLLEKGVDYTQKDQHGSTAFHYACTNGLKDFATLILAKANEKSINLAKKNSEGKTPLNMLLSSPLWEGKAANMREYLACILDYLGFSKNEITSINSELENLGISALLPALQTTLLQADKVNSSISLFETPFLLHDVELGKTIFKTLSHDEIQFQRKRLLATYKASFIEHFYFDLELNFEAAHFLKGQEVIPPQPQGIDLEDLVDFFDELNTNNPNSEDYFDSKALCDETGKFTLEELGDLLEDFIVKVEARTAYIGTPKDVDEREAFYQTIENALTNVVLKLNLQDNTLETRKQKRDLIIELLQEGVLCGGKIYTTSIELFYKIVKNSEPTLENLILRSLSEFRKILLKSLVSDDDQNIHEYNYIMNKLGAELGIQGARELSNFNDPFRPNIALETIRKRFFELYTPYQVINEWLVPKLRTEGLFREKYVAYWKENAYVDFGKDMHKSLREEVQRLEGSKASQQEIGKYLESQDVFLDKQTLDEALEGVRTHAFIAETYEDINTNLFKKNYISDMLVNLNIFTTTHHCAG